jgi:hypothetical protein
MAERRLVEARAWSGMGRFEAALEILETDKSKEAADLRAEITWRQKEWAAAGPLFEKALGERWKNPAALSSEEEGKLLRAGVAYSLAGNEAALGRLEAQYRGFIDQSHNPEALRVALSGANPTGGRLSVADFGRVSADNEAFAGWVARAKTRFHTSRVPTGGKPAAAPAPAKQAAASPPPGASA